jgi:Flp pilus assembly protein TadG
MTAATNPGNDRGETSIQTVLLVPVILSILFISVHAAALGHAGQVASVAANRGAQLAATSDNSSESTFVTRQEVRRTVMELGSQLRSEPQLSAYMGNVRVTVRIGVPRIVPFLPDVVTRSASAPIERFIEEQDRR